MDRSQPKASREARPLSDRQIVALERRTAVGCLRAAREQLELAAVSMTIVSSVDGDESTFRDADDLLEAATHIARTLERQIALRALLAEQSAAASHAPGLARAKAARGTSEGAASARNERGAKDVMSAREPLSSESADGRRRAGRVVH